MGIATGLTKERMLEIEAASIVGGSIDPVTGNLILEKHDGTLIDAGPVAGKNVMGVGDSSSIDFSISGVGTEGDPWLISGDLNTQFVTDWNNATTPGLYYSTDAANSPTTVPNTWFMGRVYVYPPSGRITQEVRHSNNFGHRNLLVRYWNGTAWSEWAISNGAGRGSSSVRDTLFPLPTTDADRVKLANRKVRWYNEDLGWEESYYAPSSLSGLTTPGLIAGVSAGWYPTGEGGPIAAFYPTATFSATTGALVGNWHNGSIRRKGGSAFCEAFSTGRIQVKIPGWYEIEVQTTLVSGTGTCNFHLRHVDSANNVLAYIDTPMTLMSSFNTKVKIGMQLYSVQANEQFELFCQTGNLTVHAGSSLTTRGQFVIRYLGPAITLS